MTQKLHHIVLNFENIDYIEIPARYFWRITVSDIRATVWCYGSGEVQRGLTAHHVSLCLTPQANTATLEGDVHEIQHMGKTLFDRLQRPDIVSIKLVYEDGTKEAYGVLWEKDPDNEFRNQLQTAVLNDDGSFCVEIGR